MSERKTIKYIPPHRRRNQATTVPQSEQRQSKNNGHGDAGGNFNNNSQCWQPNRARLRAAQETLRTAIPCAYCINLKHRTDKWKRLEQSARNVSDEFFTTILRRFEAVEGTLAADRNDDAVQTTTDVNPVWESELDATYNPKQQQKCITQKVMTAGEIGCALSHIALWRQLVASDVSHVLILEDDCQFATFHGRDRFAMAFHTAWQNVPSDWGILYLGFSPRGEFHYVHPHCTTDDSHHSNPMDPPIDIFKPSYGYHTHAYMITRGAAQTLLDNLPVQGPIDVFLADHNWFGIPTYCAVIANEGWKRDDGTYEGKNLIHQHRGKGFRSDVQP